MHFIAKTVLVLGAGVLLPAGAGVAGAAAYPGACSVRDAHHRVRDAERAVARAQARLSEARHVERDTRAVTRSYGGGVGRFVFMARRAGWTWSAMRTLWPVMSRESGGNPADKNPTSTASGLGQFLAFWFDGSDASVAAIFHRYHLSYPWNPFNAWQHLLHWWAVVRYGGWGPWALTL